jgi:integrase
MSFVTSSDTPFIARNVYREFKKACRKAGLPSFRFHDLRRTVGTRLAQAGHDLYAIAKGLGHKKFSTTERYAKHNIQSLRKVVDTLDRKNGDSQLTITIYYVVFSKKQKGSGGIS